MNRFELYKNTVISKLDSILSFFEIDVLKDSIMYYGTCPIHNGDNQTALNLYHEGAKVPGYWVCNTHKCHEKYKRHIYGFIAAMLEKKHKEKYNAYEALNWCEKFLNGNVSIQPNIRKINKVKETEISISSLSRLNIPSKYFLNRGFSSEVLKKYNVGDCFTKKKPMYLRSVVPIFDIYGKKIIGVTGRSIFEECNNCKMFHYGIKCPDKQYSRFFSKWRNYGFSKTSSLYNYWFAISFIQKYSVIFVVEGPSDVWRLIEAGIYNCVAIYGTSLSEEQKILIERSGAYKIILIMDDDCAGIDACKKISEKFDGYKIITVNKNLKKISNLEILGLI